MLSVLKGWVFIFRLRFSAYGFEDNDKFLDEIKAKYKPPFFFCFLFLLDSTETKLVKQVALRVPPHRPEHTVLVTYGPGTGLRTTL